MVILKIKLLTFEFFNQEMKQELVDFKDVISSLQLLSKKVVPLPQRKSKLKSKLLVDPVCSYKNMQVSLIYTHCPSGKVGWEKYFAYGHDDA